MYYHILVYDKHNSIIDYMLNDLKYLSDVQFDYVINIDCYSNNKLVYYLKKFISKVLWLFRKKKWFYSLKHQNSHVIITNEAILGLKREDIIRLHEMDKKVIGLFIDSLSSNYVTISKAKTMMDLFDVIYTFDPFDAKEFGLNYTNQLYSQINAKVTTHTISDLYYIGHIKSREPFIKKLVDRGNTVGATMNIQLLGVDKSHRLISGVRYLSKRKPYEEVINDLLSSRCILDITQEGQTGVTLRYYEAVIYNKKLITNNDNIIHLPYYNANYMRIYHTIEDFDWSWIMKDEQPEYHYVGDFSPTHLINHMDNDEMRL